jgi:hypothetical protein
MVDGGLEVESDEYHANLSNVQSEVCGWCLGTGYWILDTGYCTLDIVYWILDTGYCILETVYWRLDILGTVSDIGIKYQVSGIRYQASGVQPNRKRETPE